MKNEDLIYDSVCRVEDKLDKHIADTTRYVSRAELMGWFTIFGGFFVGALALV